MAEQEHNEEIDKGGRPLKFTLKELQDSIEQYFESCWDHKRDMFGGRIIDKEGSKEDGDLMKFEYVMIQVKPYTITGLAVHLKTTRDLLIRYGKTDEFYDTIKEAKDKIYAYAEESLFIGKNQSGTIFNMKNNYGWVDKTEQEVKITNEFDSKSDDELKKYIEDGNTDVS